MGNINITLMKTHSPARQHNTLPVASYSDLQYKRADLQTHFETALIFCDTVFGVRWQTNKSPASRLIPLHSLSLPLEDNNKIWEKKLEPPVQAFD